MPREQSERAPKQGFGDSENDKATGSTAMCRPRIEQVSVNLTVNGRTRTVDRTPSDTASRIAQRIGSIAAAASSNRDVRFQLAQKRTPTDAIAASLSAQN